MFDIAMRQTDESRGEVVKICGWMNSNLQQVSPEQIFNMGTIGQIEEHDLIEPAPESRIEQALVIRCGNRHRIAPKSVEDLKERIDDTFDLAVFL